MKIYLDTCVYCRPFDDQSDKDISRETEAFASILESPRFAIVGSDILDDEIFQIEKRDVRLDVKAFTNICKEFVPLTEKIIQEARKLMERCI